MARQFKISPQDRFPSQTISLPSHIGTTNKIVKKKTINKIVKEKLTLTQLALFEKMVFGRFVNMDIIFNSPLVHYILLTEVVDDRKNIMTFDLNGTVVTFFKEDFPLVTGLWRSSDPIFVRRGDIIIGALETMYKEMEFEKDMDVVKMTLICCTELGMIGREKMRANVDKILLIDVEDLDYFNSWENVLWERTLLGLQ
ncbi:uncharacterized protein LOC120084503 [Benincasa hispida]|uniref:uncharacterized protein LOC120084503 n=1 Tax=Benincasa hispida TaxID=102211 RepID=UPI0019025706|nr:uncharacterized protein LOC120084503 [Benincasa hispida]